VLQLECPRHPDWITVDDPGAETRGLFGGLRRRLRGGSAA
jgi:hypothetical protein